MQTFEQTIDPHQLLLFDQPMIDFEGLSPNEIDNLLFDPFYEESPLKIDYDLDNKEFNSIPFLKMVHHFLILVNENQPIKLTPSGNLPLKLCKELLDLNYINDFNFELNFDKNIKSETDSLVVHLTNLNAGFSGLIKKRDNKITLTKKGLRIIENEDRALLLEELFSTFTTKYNWSYSFLTEDIPLIQKGFCFSIFLLKKYGAIEHPVRFYAEKFLASFPLFENIENEVFTKNFEFDPSEEFIRNYVTKTFKLFMTWFGFIDVSSKEQSYFSFNYNVKKSQILDKMFKIVLSYYNN